MKSKVLFTVLFAAFILAVSGVYASTPDKITTVKNLKDAIIGETTASTKYNAYAEKAREEGHQKIALLFEAASKSEAVHANNHRAALEQLGETMGEINPEYSVGTTKENLEDALKGETYEVVTMYPDFIKNSSEAKYNIATLTFNYAYQTEKKHQALYKSALEMLNNRQEDLLPEKYMVCTTCGNTYNGEAPNRCGISMTPKERFITIQ